MRKRSILLASVLLMSLLAAAPAHQAGAGPSAGGLSSDNVEFIRHIPLAQDGVGGRVIGDYFYANDQNKIMIFDITTPEDPQLTGTVPMPQEWLLSREDLDGNGEILVVPNTVSGMNDGSSGGTNAVYIIDVEDKTNPVIISKVAGAAQHTFSCVLDCKWAYGSGGNIIDLRDPANPKLVDEKWGDGMPASSGHDIEEIGPGLVLTATNPLMLLDVKKDPTHPKLLAVSPPIEDVAVMHSGRWANNGKDNFFVMGTEAVIRPRCNENKSNGHLMTVDASNWKKTHTLGPVLDRHYQVNGTYADGNPPAGVSCSSHWLELHPDFHNGGLVAHARFEHGTQFMEVDSKGKIKQVGYFLAHGGSAGAAYWVTDEIVYVLDYNRGIDVIRFTGKT